MHDTQKKGCIMSLILNVLPPVNPVLIYILHVWLEHSGLSPKYIHIMHDKTIQYKGIKLINICNINIRHKHDNINRHLGSFKTTIRKSVKSFTKYNKSAADDFQNI